MNPPRRARVLGQHFLSKPEILDKMVEYAELSKSDVVLEVGAGRGELTRRLAERAGLVIAVEIDPRLLGDLRRIAEEYPNVKVVAGDVLRIKPSGFNKVVSNPPYSISLRLMEWLIDSRPELMVLTLQREFASKLVAEPGSRKYLYISVLSKLSYDSRIIELIPRHFFNPPPKVDSALIVMKLRDDAPQLKESWKRILKTLFTRRRQKLRKVLRDLLLEAGETDEELGRLDEDMLSRRIYELEPSELLEVARFLEKRFQA